MRGALFLAVACAAVSVEAQSQTQTPRYSIHSGSPSGVYFPVAGALCRLANETRAPGDARCRAQASGGGAANLAALAAGEAQIVFAQSDWVRAAVAGEGPFADAPMTDLRVVMALHPEPLTIVIKDGGPSRLSRLRGRPVAVGAEGSSAEVTFTAALAADGLTLADLGALNRAPADAAVKALCEGEVAAAVFVTGHPSLAIADAAESCAVDVMAVDSRAARRLARSDPAFRRGAVPDDVYRGVNRTRRALAVTALVVARADAPEEAVYRLTRAALEGAERLGGLHPALTGLTPAALSNVDAYGPIHPGAARAFADQ